MCVWGGGGFGWLGRFDCSFVYSMYVPTCTLLCTPSVKFDLI